jgi:hypothetical protein
MKDKKQYNCPISNCGFGSDSIESVVNHISAKRDESHAGVNGNDRRDEITMGSADSGSGSPESSGVEPATFPDGDAADSGESSGDESHDCCDDPDRINAASHHFRLENGDMIEAESDDEFCESCGAVIEADGTVLR